ncbi:MAG: hypothetical protein ACTS3R_02710 [Inquilinaceae bacterium]
MTRRPIRPIRARIFVGCEGEGEQAFAAWLQRLIDGKSLPFHLDVHVLHRGDVLRRVEDAIRLRNTKATRKGDYKHAILLFDDDLLSGQHGESANRVTTALALTDNSAFSVIRQRPSLEGLLLRLHEGQATREVPRDIAERELKKVWPNYAKVAPAADLERRFSLDDLSRAAAYDHDLRKLLTLLKLMA